MDTPERRPRGRPRQYDPDAALQSAARSFWTRGFAATSVDDLAAATGMNRPSLYAAFGDKRSLYLKTLEQFRQHVQDGARALLADDPPLREFLARFYKGALDVYISGPDAKGCYGICTATTEAAADPEIRAVLERGIRDLDAFFEGLVRVARERQELSAQADPVVLGRLASMALHTMAVRARAGFPRAELEAIATATADIICRA